MTHAKTDLGHSCLCGNCSAALRVTLSPATDHFGVQFPGHAANLRVFRGDEDISTTTWQVVAGREGTAWRYSYPPHLCDCGLRAQVCAYLDHARFVVAGPLPIGTER